MMNVTTDCQAIIDTGINAAEFLVLAAIQHQEGKRIALSWLAQRTHLSRRVLVQAINNLRDKEYIVITKPDKRINGREFDDCTRLIKINRHKLYQAEKFLNLPMDILWAYPARGRAEKVRVHLFQMLYVFQNDMGKVDAKKLPYISPRAVARALKMNERHVHAAYAIQRAQGWLQEKPEAPERKRVALHGQRRTFVNVTDSKLKLARRLIGELPMETVERILAALAPTNRAIDCSDFLDALQDAKARSLPKQRRTTRRQPVEVGFDPIIDEIPA